MNKRVFLYDAIRSNRIGIVLCLLVFLFIVFSEIVLLVLLVTPEKWSGRLAACLPEILIWSTAIAVTLSLLYSVCCYFIYRKWLTLFFDNAAPPPEIPHKLELALADVRLATGMMTLEARVAKMGGVNATIIPGTPTIMVSEAAVKELDGRELEALLAHESYHMKSHDDLLWVLAFGVAFLVSIFYDIGWDMEDENPRCKRLFILFLNGPRP